MDTERPDEGSNSPSDRVVLRIQFGGAGGEVAHIDLSDGSSFFLPTDHIQGEGLHRGDRLSDERYGRLSFRSEVFAAEQKSVDLLALREQSRYRLTLKLRKRGFSDTAIRQALDVLSERGELDDLRFARQWVAARLRRNPEGRTRLYAGLLAQGVSRDKAEAALRDYGESEEAEALKAAVNRAAGRSGMTRERLVRRLVGKGFAYRDACNEADQVFAKGREDDIDFDWKNSTNS